MSENEEVITNSVKIIVNGKEFEVELEENSATKELLERLKNGDVTITFKLFN